MSFHDLRTLALAGLAGLLLAASAPAQNLYQARRTQGGILADLTARHVGDLLTVVVAERHRVKNEDKVERTNDTSLAARLEAYTLSNDTFKTNTLPRFDVTQSRSFDGEAKQEKDSQVEARVSVIVVDVLPNGTLVIAGSRVVEVDDEVKTLKISGLVRQLDVTTENTVTSSQVADARVSICGEGGNTRNTTRGPVGQLFDTLIWAAWPF